MSEIINVNVTKIEELVTINALPNVTQIVVTTSSGGAVESVNGQNGVVELTTNDIPETATKVYLTPAEKTAITHTNRTILDAITEAFTTTLKSSYDSAVSWISTNGATLISHLTDYANPHQTTAAQVGAYTTTQTDTLLNDKVDKITGKGLSTNDYTDTEKTKLAGIEDGATNVTKTSDLINDGDNGISHFISLEDLPSNIVFYPTNVASDISGYVKIVTSITDPSYNTTAVDISTGAITTTNQLISSLATSPNIIVGNPGVFNITTIGNIRRISGSGQASFYFKVYKRTLAGVETLVATSDNTIPVIDGGTYVEFSATGLWDDGIFLDTDRVVMKYYANRISGGSNPTYQFQFGGVTPVRTLVPIPLSVVPSIPLDGLNDVTISSVANEDFLRYESSTSLWKNIQITSAFILNKLGITTLSGSNTGDNATNTQYSGLAASKEDTSNKVTTFTGNETSTTKFPVVKAIIDYFTSSRLATILGYTPENTANKQNSLVIDGTGVKFPTVDAVNNLSFIDKMKRGIQFFTDFEGEGNAVPYLRSFQNGTGATTNRLIINIPNQSLNQIGFCQYQTGTTLSGYAAHFSEVNVGSQFQIGGGSWVFESSIEIQDLSTVLERFRFLSGFASGGSNSNAIIFTYDEGGTANGTTASPYWQCVTSNASVRTLTTTNVLVNTNWNTLRIEVNAAGTSVVFKINGSIVATHTTNMPVGLSRFNVQQGIYKSIGITNRSVFCDYLGYENYLTTPRP